MKKVTVLAAIFVAMSWCWAGDDETAVREAILDYVEGVYEVAPERIARSVHPDMRKHGFAMRDGSYIEMPMTFQQLKDLAARYNKDGRIGRDAPKEIIIFDIQDQTASAKLIAAWGQDYFHLAKYDGKWMITNVLWQSLPK